MEAFKEKGDEFDNIKLNDMFSLSYNFDILKYIINNLVKNQQKLNYKLIELKIDKVYNEMKVERLESNILDLQQPSKIRKDSKNDLLTDKNKTKNYKEIIDKLTREKENYLQLIKKSNRDNIILNTKTEYIDNEDIKETNELNEKINRELKKEIDEKVNEINIKVDELREEIEEKINNNSKILETKIENFDKIISLINNEIKLNEEKLNLKFSEELPKIFENLLNKNMEKFNSKIEVLQKEVKQDIRNFENYKKDIKEKLDLEDLKYNDNIKENQKIFKEIYKQTNKIEQKMDDFVEIKIYNSAISGIENKIKKEYNELNNNIITMKQNIDNIIAEISDIKNDKTNKNNFLLLSTRCDNINSDINKLNEIIMEFNSERQKLEELDPNKLIYKIDFEDFIESNSKVIENIKNYLSDMKYMMDDIKISSSKGNASLKDLKMLEDKIISKMIEFSEQINEKFAEKKFVLRNNRFLKIEINQKLDNFKNTDQRTEGTGWLLSKKPIGGHLCASCESYIGDLKDNDKYIPWNQIHIKDSNDKNNKVNHLFSKMFQKLSTDYRIKRNKSTLYINSSKNNNENSLEEMEQRQSQTNITNKRKSIDLKDNIIEKKLKKKIKIKEIPNIKISKKNNFGNNYKSKNNEEINSKTEKDENIILPENCFGNKKNEKDPKSTFYPKVIKVFKKLN